LSWSEVIRGLTARTPLPDQQLRFWIMVASREIRLKRRFVGAPIADNFELATVSVPAPAPGEVQVKNLWISVDPYMRGRMVDRTSYDPHLALGEATPAREVGEVAASNSTMYGWRPPFQLGEALQGGAVGEVVASEDTGFKPGDLVSSMFGWRERFNAPASTVEKLDTLGLPPQAFLGVAGVTGLTAWGGLLKIAALKSGDVVFVSAAAGAVGSVACQIAKVKGHTVIGSAGGANKCAFLRHIGVDHIIDYKATSNLTDALLRAAPKGIDVYFDNVGGNHLEAALAAANRFARFVLCGMISQYNTVGLPDGPRNIMFVIGKCIRLEGLDVANYFNLLPEFHRDLSGWIRDGKLVWKESVEQGIENAPTAFLKLFEGENFGKMLVKLA
jgi:NADPH-dependent curcumin reductase CurA